jgi:protein-L-isoaspartate(D-aspartate) O-methyltransferase
VFDQSDPSVLRGKLVDTLMASGFVRSDRVADALRAVPRHRFIPEATPHVAYDDSAYVTKRNEIGMAVSSVSAPHVIAVMLELLDVQPGHRVLEIGSGGYNAALLAELAGATGRVTTIDIDLDVVNRARLLLPAAGYDTVVVRHGDGETGDPDDAPYDRIIVTARADDIPPAWWQQLAPGGRIVMPLDIRGLTRAVAFDRDRHHLVSGGYHTCGFVRMQGACGGTQRLERLAGREVVLRHDGGQQLDVEALRAAVREPGEQMWSGVTVRADEACDDLDLYLATISPTFALLAVQQSAADIGLVSAPWRSPVPALIDGDSFAYRSQARAIDEARTRLELGARGNGPRGDLLAATLNAVIRTWHSEVRGGPGARIMAVRRIRSEVPYLPGRIIDKRHTRFAITWSS